MIGFSDASEAAYYTVIYICTVDEKSNEVTLRLVCAKTRIAPLKELTIPKLELTAALLLVNLLKRVSDKLKIPPDQICAFTDSMVVLGWLSKPPDKYKVYVWNRSRKIVTYLPSKRWRYVNTKENPADLATRGMSVKSSIQCDLWSQ